MATNDVKKTAARKWIVRAELSPPQKIVSQRKEGRFNITSPVMNKRGIVRKMPVKSRRSAIWYGPSWEGGILSRKNI